MIDVENELFELYQEVSRVKKFKYFYIDSPFLKEEEEKVQKNRIFVVLICKLIFYLITLILCVFVLYHYLQGKMFLIGLVASSSVCLIIAIFSVTKALTKFAILSGYSDIYFLKRAEIYEAFKKYLETRKFTVNQIEKYLLPYLKSNNEDRQSGSVTTFLKIIIPTIFVSVITSCFTLIINSAVEEGNLKQEELDQALYVWLGLGFVTVILGAMVFTTIHFFQNKSSYNKNYKLMETLFYNYLLEKGKRSIKKPKRKS
ncbi:hypothetical protein [Bacillus amyloliquefaciens]|uniref:hypothetical protein n=1 Tax=Bacillus amyloliquefaciens TaxID=1390 RepID=UPI00082470C2|nr:hypothetical protein [Bacillus amyloliquefaciens]AOC90632.1 hypothetical protein BARD7_01162 [Bacillus amyloliquefaciens]RDY83880.1 hypothetical protein C3733_18600 [Bacillus amyloliquefaciens]